MILILFEEIQTTSQQHTQLIVIPEFCTRPKHDFTHLGWVDGWLGRTLESSALHCWGLKVPGGGGGYSLYDGWYICAAVFDPFFDPLGTKLDLFGVFFLIHQHKIRSFGYKSSQNSIFLAPKYHFSLDLFGSNFQWPAAHPQQFSDRVPPPPPPGVKVPHVNIWAAKPMYIMASLPTGDWWCW